MKDHQSTLLVVEENPYLANILHQIFTPEFNVVVASNGIEAMEWLEQGTGTDFIITELTLSHFNGMELIRLIRNNNLYKNIPVIVLSGVEGSSIRIKCLEEGADDYIAKPFNPLEIRAKIRVMLRRSENFALQPMPEQGYTAYQWQPARV